MARAPKVGKKTTLIAPSANAKGTAKLRPLAFVAARESAPPRAQRKKTANKSRDGAWYTSALVSSTRMLDPDVQQRMYDECDSLVLTCVHRLLIPYSGFVEHYTYDFIRQTLSGTDRQRVMFAMPARRAVKARHRRWEFASARCGQRSCA